MILKPKPDLNKFLAITNFEELAHFLGIESGKLKYLLYHLNTGIRYYTFDVKKRNGERRQIHSPTQPIKDLQLRLKEYLSDASVPKNCVHGFCAEKSIMTNARQHIRRKVIVNLDLTNFFSSINFGRVRGMFMSRPFNFNPEVATSLAQLCCNNGALPQGAPTSPVISNIICRKLDNELLNLARSIRFTYTRYADDITFSSNKNHIPEAIGKIVTNKLILSGELEQIITRNGFEVNYSKLRYALKNNRQEVTGIVVNKFPNVKRPFINVVRGMLHAWEKFGIEKAAVAHFNKEKIPLHQIANPIVYFEKRIVGKIGFIGMVRGKDDSIYQKLYERVKKLAPNAKLSIIRREIQNTDKNILLTEGKTDWKHIAAALKRFQFGGEFLNLKIHFQDYLDEHKISNGELYKMCEAYSKVSLHSGKIICLFDRDVPSFTTKVTSSLSFYKFWGNGVFSMVIPVPKHCEHGNICIEHLYRDSEIMTLDENHRRLFLSYEFDEDGKHRSGTCFFKYPEKLKNRFSFIIDNGVFNIDNENIALSKSAFANYILEERNGFDDFDINGFRKLFENIESILSPTTEESITPIAEPALSSIQMKVV